MLRPKFLWFSFAALHADEGKRKKENGFLCFSYHFQKILQGTTSTSRKEKEIITSALRRRAHFDGEEALVARQRRQRPRIIKERRRPSLQTSLSGRNPFQASTKITLTKLC
jgi:hypothetical protein